MGKSFNTGRLGNGLFTDANGNVGVNTTTLTSGIPFSINVTTGNNCNIAFQENASDKWYLRNITSSNAFSFYSVTGSTEVIRLTSDGKLGVGTSTPGRQVEIYNATDAYLKFNGQRAGNIAYTIGSDAAGFIIYDDTNGAYKFIIKQNGNVGISVTSPTYSLSFSGESAVTIGMNQSTLGTSPSITLRAADSTTGTNNEGGAVYISSGLGTGNGATSNIIFSTAPQLNSGTTRQSLVERMRISSNGNVGIGTTSPGSSFPNGQGWTYTTQRRVIEVVSTSTDANSGIFLRRPDNNTGLDMWADNYWGDTYIDNRYPGNIVFRTNTASSAGTRLTISSSGVKFQNGSTYLNYYEEGTFNPASLDTNFSGVSTIFGRYVRIGNQITINCRWNVTGSTGKRYIVFNLPFAFYDNVNICYTGAVSNYNDGASSYSSNVGTSVRNSSGSLTQQYVEAVYTSSPSGSTFLFSMTYQTF